MSLASVKRAYRDKYEKKVEVNRSGRDSIVVMPNLFRTRQLSNGLIQVLDRT